MKTGTRQFHLKTGRFLSEAYLEGMKTAFLLSSVRFPPLSEAYLEGMKTHTSIRRKPYAYLSEAYLEGMKTTTNLIHVYGLL